MPSGWGGPAPGPAPRDDGSIKIVPTPSAQRMREGILAAIRSIPRGMVATYGAVASAAGYPGNARRVASVLHRSVGLPWQRVLGSGGEIKLRGDSAIEQRLRLESEGVVFRGRRVDMKRHEFKFQKKKTARRNRSRRSTGRAKPLR